MLDGTKFKAWQIATFIGLGILALAAGMYFGDQRQQASVAAGQSHLQPFTLPDSQGTPRSSSEWRQKPLLINFWATWCKPCREELPLFVETQKQFPDNELQVLAIALDSPDAVKRFMQDIGFNFPSLIAEAEGMDMMGLYGNTGALPFTIAVDAERRIVGKRLGKINQHQIDTFVQNLVEGT